MESEEKHGTNVKHVLRNLVFALVNVSPNMVTEQRITFTLNYTHTVQLKRMK